MIGLQELILILAIFLILFGPEKMPEIAKGIGTAIQEFKKASNVIPESDRLLRKDEKEKENVK